MEIGYSKQAIADIEEIDRYLWENAPEYADQVLDGLLGKIERLNALPNRGAPVREMQGSGVNMREIYFRPYNILYLVEENAVMILSVYHGKRKRRKFKLE